MDATTAAAAEPRPARFFSHLAGMYAAPRREFERILARPNFWAPAAVFLALNLAFTAVWVMKVDPVAFMNEQLEASGRADRIPADQRDEMVQTQAKFLPVFAWLGPAVFIPVFIVGAAGLYLFIFRFVFGGDLRFVHSLAVLAWSSLAVALVTTPLTLLVLVLKDDWNVDPRTALQANLSLLLDREDTPKPLWALAESLDVFSFWTLGLLAAGYGAAARRPTSSALFGVAAPWAVYVLGKVALAAAF